ncbi:MAG: hypothetical protein ABJE66_07370 [Deltaproteobacteria bacterium]
MRITLERAKQIAGFDRVVDGYAEACKLATAALAAGKAAVARHAPKRAENELAIHAVLAGSSEELDQLLAPDRVTFGQLVPATR